MAEALRVLHLIFDLKKGGGERFAIDVCRQLSTMDGLEVRLACLSEANEYEEITQGVPIVCLGDYYDMSIFKRSRVKSDAYRGLLDSFRPNIIHTHLLRAELFSTLEVRPDIAYVTHGHDNMIQFRPFSWRTPLSKTKLTNFVEKRVIYRRKYARTRTYFVANSEDTLAYYKKVLPKKMVGDVRLIQYGFDFARFHADRRSGPCDPRIKLLNIGSYHEEKKNQIFLVAIAKLLRQRGVDFEIHQLGDGPGRSRVERAVAENGLSDGIFFHGNVDNVPQWLAKSDIYLHTAWYEPFGLVFLEAMAAGLPIVALDGKGNRGLVRDGHNGFFILSQDPAVFADRIQQLATRPEEYRTMAENGPALARGFDIKTKTEELVAFYRKIARFESAGPTSDA